MFDLGLGIFLVFLLTVFLFFTNSFKVMLNSIGKFAWLIVGGWVIWAIIAIFKGVHELLH